MGDRRSLPGGGVLPLARCGRVFLEGVLWARGLSSHPVNVSKANLGEAKLLFRKEEMEKVVGLEKAVSLVKFYEYTLVLCEIGPRATEAE